MYSVGEHDAGSAWYLGTPGRLRAMACALPCGVNVRYNDRTARREADTVMFYYDGIYLRPYNVPSMCTMTVKTKEVLLSCSTAA